MSIDLFANIVSNTFDNTIDDIVYLADNGYIKYNSSGYRFLYWRLKEFVWLGLDDHYDSDDPDCIISDYAYMNILHSRDI